MYFFIYIKNLKNVLVSSENALNLYVSRLDGRTKQFFL